MSNREWTERQSATSEDRREYEQERLVLWTTDKIAEMMNEAGVSKADLARALGTSRPNVTALLSGSRNMTLRTLADVCFVLGYRADLHLEPLRHGEYISTPAQLVRNLRPRVVEMASLTPTGEDTGTGDATRLVA